MDLIGDENHPKILARIEERNEKQIERNAKADELHQCQKQLEKLEKQLLDTALSISKMISSGKPISERKRAAIEMFEQGNNKGVLDMLNEEEIERDYQSAKRELQAGQALIDAGEKAKEAARDKIRSLVEEYLLKAKTWMSTYSEANRFEEACKCYEKAIAHTRESLTEEELAGRLFSYGYFLQVNNQYHRVETYYQEALEIYEQLATIFPETYEANVSNTFNNLANVYHCMHRFKEAEECHLRALEIRERLAAKHPEAYEAMVAGTLTNLANLYCKTQRFVEAEKFYIRSLSIYEQLAANSPEIYEIDIARTLYNFAGTYLNIKRFAEAEE
jgi:tetratricopeptide (TPR) repeat protein